jgi:nicotinate phosphoribosyltransferase
MRIINSILDNDLYKFSMGNAVFNLFPRLKVKYQFTDRNNLSYPDGFDEQLKFHLLLMKPLSLSSSEKKFLEEKCGKFLPPTYIDFLKGFRYDPSEVTIKLDENNKLDIQIEGYWYRTILWEVVLMSLISELYFQETEQIVDISKFNTSDTNKVKSLVSHNSYFADFGSRRRYSFDNQNRIVELFKKEGGHNFVGSSNVYLSFLHDVSPIGTHAHEWFMAHAAMYGYKMANEMALDNWVNVYKGDLGIALTDTFTTDVFLKSFTMKYAKLFDGVRHDSGDPFKFTDKIIAHYKSLGIDPMSKVIVFSDGLNCELVNELKEYCVGKIKSSFGIGTHFTNDVGVKPLNIVIKIYQILMGDDWVNCIKISDNPGKHAGVKEEVELSKQILKL